jgi:uncharacterized protein YnzC (UPF0291/DUF896 family)
MLKNKKNGDILVNGPVNAFRLEGKIGDKNKIIYLFGDYHNPISAETKCDSFISADFVSYFYKTMEKTDPNIKYDFIFENYSDTDMFDEYKYSQTKYREQYLDEIRKYVDSDMDISETVDVKNETTKYKNKGSKTFDNLRLHYLDVRSFYGSEEMGKILTETRNLLNSLRNNFNGTWIVDRLIVNFYNLKHNIQFLINHFIKIIYKKNDFEDTKIKVTNENLRDEILDYRIRIQKPLHRRSMQYSKKIFDKYHNKEIGEKLKNSDMIISILKSMKSAKKMINGCINKLLKIQILVSVGSYDLNKNHMNIYRYGKDILLINKILCQIDHKYAKIFNEKTQFLFLITDLYLLRKFLDKNYIDHAIVYTGMDHTENYVYTLVKEFGFKITHFDYLKLGAEKTNQIIHEKTLDEMHEILLKPELKQCSNMTNFPELFL